MEIVTAQAYAAYQAFEVEIKKQKSQLQEDIDTELDELEKLRSQTQADMDSVEALQARIRSLEEGMQRIHEWRKTLRGD